MKRARSERSDRVSLNVGGTRIETTRVTLSASTYFARMLDGDWVEGVEEEVFVDRDPALFTHILEWLRSGQLPRLPRYHSDPGLWRALRLEAADARGLVVARGQQ